MNDYLWEKQGTDPEIERLEDLLSGFAYSETPPPVVIKEAPIPFFRRLLNVRVLVPIAAAVFLMLVGGTIWTYSRLGQKGEPSVAPAPASITTTSAKNDEKVIAANPTQVVDEKTPSAVRRAFVKAAATTNGSRVLYAKQATPKPAVRLTKEEKYAYDQLMLALSFTSSKLKMVRDAANAVDETDSPTTKPNR
ncbi:MAG: hypothetical protein JO053_08650 [Acidobacteria bacterium]|nr:hypothetical protein [Acidobacteriota bacterium]